MSGKVKKEESFKLRLVKLSTNCQFQVAAFTITIQIIVELELPYLPTWYPEIAFFSKNYTIFVVIINIIFTMK